MDVCTIIAKNYVPAARVLGRSLTAQHPGTRLHVLVIDDWHGYLDSATEPFEIVTPEALGIERFEWMAAVYDVLELSTAVKPWLLRHMLARSGARGALYLDPDIRIYGSLQSVFDAVAEYGLVLNPHNIDPMPRDGLKPNEQDILIAGAYNLGFIGLRDDEFSSFLLDWWAERLATECIVDPARGFFVDQRWMDFAPGLATDFHLVRDPGFNVAYWNLPTREVVRQCDGRYTVNGAPLTLFHFSGFQPDKPHLLSKHQNRIRLGDRPALARLCADYAQELLDEDWRHASQWPYTYAKTWSGIPLDQLRRRAYRRSVEDVPAEEALGPFSEEGERRFLAWCNSPAGVGGEFGVTRFIEALREYRNDLAHAFPRLEDELHGRSLVDWVQSRGVHEMSLPDVLVPGNPAFEAAAAALPVGGAAVAVADAEAATVPVAPPDAVGRAVETPRTVPSPVLPVAQSESGAGGWSVPDGVPPVNVTGYLQAELGVGEVARQIISALDTAGVPLAPITLSAGSSREEHEFATAGVAPEDAPFDVNIVCVNADMLPAFAEQAGPRFFAGRTTIGVWWWELSEFPDRWRGSFDHLDELWAGSRFVAEALAAKAPCPVVHMPLPIEVPQGIAANRDAFHLPPGFTFLFSFDFNSVFARKNPLGLIDAFTRAFEPGEGVRLVIKSINGDRHPDALERLHVAAADSPHVRLLEGYLPARDKYRLMASCDAYVSLHRSEGFGIGMAEALLLGKPVVATAYGGNTDFLTANTGFPVRYELAKVGPGAEPYDPESTWAEPDLDHAAKLLRHVVENPQEAAERTRQGGELLRRAHSREAAGRAMAARLRVMAGRADDAGRAPIVPAPRSEGVGSTPDELDAAVDAVLERIARGSQPGSSSPLGKLGPKARQVALRAMRPYTAHADVVQRELAELVRREQQLMRREIVRVRRQAMLDQAGVLAELRRLASRLEEQEQQLRALAGSSEADVLQDHGQRLERLQHQRDHASARIDDLADQTDQLRLDTQELRNVLTAAGLAATDPGESSTGLPQAPDDEPWSSAYTTAHREFVARVLDDPALLALFRRSEDLPAGFGRGFDERVVEYPWVAAQRLSGAVLDAGSTLNHVHVLNRLRPRVDDLDIVTLAPEKESFTQLEISYLYADLRELPVIDGRYDRVVSISTLEHVGLDNTYYGASTPSSADPQADSVRAIRELRRVLRHGGDLYLTLPVGRGERFSWVRSLTHDELDELVAAFEPSSAPRVTYFRHDVSGWALSTREATADAIYRDHFSSGPVGPDRTVAAQAVACVHLVK